MKAIVWVLGVFCVMVWLAVFAKSQMATSGTAQAVPAAQAAIPMINPKETRDVYFVAGVSALEFLRIESNFASEAPLMTQVVIGLVAKGYKNVPDWARLSRVTKERILKMGYISQDVGKIAEEAALTSGMTR